MALNTIQRNVLRSVLRTKLLRNFSVSSVYLKDEDSKDKAAQKLNSLLQSIIKDDSLEKETPKTMSPSSEKIVPKKKKIEKPKDLGKRIVESSEEIAQSLPGKPEETQAQLLHKLLYKDKPLTDSIVKAASGKQVLMDLLSDMPVEMTPKKMQRRAPTQENEEYTKADKVRDVLGRKSNFYRKKSVFIQEESIDLFSEKPLGIFSTDEKFDSEIVPLNTWDALRQRDLRLLVTHPPRNIYEQMIIWTERGMLWKFPIDNEQGMDEEKKVDFTEHVFLETHLEDWCPDKGPIRQFMELVCVGLSRNHYLTAQEKKDHILWYKDFFTSKKELIHELGAGEIKEVAHQ